METRISECRVCHEMFESGTLGRKKRKCNGCIKEGLRVYWRNWQRRKQGILRQGQSKDQGCFVCGYKLTLTKYKEGPVIRFLCPNHYALVMRRIKTMDQLILAKGYLAWLREETEKLTETVFLNMQQKKFSGSVVAPQAPINKTPPVYKMGPKGLMVDNKAQATTL